MSLSLEQFIAFFSYFFVCFGISHHIPITSQSHLVRSTLWMGFLFVLLLAAIAVLFHFSKQLLSDTGPLSTGIDAFQLMGPIICHVILIGESLFCSEEMHRMWKCVEEIEALMGEEKRKVNSKFFRTFITKFVASQLIPIVIETYITLSIGKAPEWQRHWIARTYSFNALRLATTNYILWVDYIASRGGFLSTELERLEGEMRKIGMVPVFDPTLLVRLENFRRTHRCIWKLVQEVNERFKWFILTSVTNTFLSITIDLYWIYGNFRFGGNPFAFREYFREWDDFRCS